METEFLCPSVNEEYMSELPSIVEITSNKVKPHHVPLPTERMLDSPSLKRRENSPLEKSFNVSDRETLKHS